ncbi:MAG: alpha-L-fucosidase, partial [Calditrichaeota bacterium]
DLKFGLLMHWGPYSQWGIVESWSICPEDYPWCRRTMGPDPQHYFRYLRSYEKLQTTFNPTKFNPQKWAEAAKAAGMRYVVFTTKHHDGFCMFDSKYTDYKITSEKCPFYSNPKADIAKEIFTAFREKGLWAGAYFSKPDWHNEYYWHPYFPPLDRNVNYDPELHPDWWQKFVEYTHNQIMELVTRYGPIDILWLDGGWVSKKTPDEIKAYYWSRLKEAKSGFIKNRVVSQDIRLGELVQKARQKKPDLIVVDRAVEGLYQNYLTPENTIPDSIINVPWESCIISGGGWSWVPKAKYKSAEEVIKILINIVSKGGNLLLNIAPRPDGEWDEEAYALLSEVGRWLKINGEAIYATRAWHTFKQGNVWFTRKKDDSAIYALVTDEMPKAIKIENLKIINNTKINMLGSTLELPWKYAGTGIEISIPEQLRKNPPCKFAWAFKIPIKN